MRYTIIFSGKHEVYVPTPIACELKHFINKFRIKVVDVLITPYDDLYEVTLYVERLSRKRRFQKAMDRLERRVVRKYDYGLVVIEE